MKLKETKSPVLNSKAYRSDSNCAIIVSCDPVGPGGALRWHLSISHNKRYPHWDEVKAARYQLVPNDVMVAMFLPPMEEYVDVHKYCFHLYQIEAQDHPAAIIT